jgi:hypothetical protein
VPERRAWERQARECRRSRRGDRSGRRRRVEIDLALGQRGEGVADTVLHRARRVELGRETLEEFACAFGVTIGQRLHGDKFGGEARDLVVLVDQRLQRGLEIRERGGVGLEVTELENSEISEDAGVGRGGALEVALDRDGIVGQLFLDAGEHVASEDGKAGLVVGKFGEARARSCEIPRFARDEGGVIGLGGAGDFVRAHAAHDLEYRDADDQCGDDAIDHPLPTLPQAGEGFLAQALVHFLKDIVHARGCSKRNGNLAGSASPGNSTKPLGLWPFFEGVGLFFPREGAGAHIRGESIHSLPDLALQIGIAADEFGGPVEHAQKVVRDEDLAVAGGRSADSDGGAADLGW